MYRGEEAAEFSGRMVGLKVLIVEDEVDFLALVRSWLEDEGYEVYAATNG